MGFSRYYNSLGITFEESIQTNTNRIISYLDQLGRMLGYYIFSEHHFEGLFKTVGKECPPDFRSKKPDVCWGYTTEKDRLEYELILESEQQMDEEKIGEEIRKLLIFPSKLKVLYCAHSDPQTVIKLVRKEANKVNRTDGHFLVIIDPWVNRGTFGVSNLEGKLLNSNLEVTHVGFAKVYEFEEGPWRKRLFKNAVWIPESQMKYYASEASH
jgi:hypothetical protein